MTDTPEPTGRFASLAIPEFRRLWWGGVFVFLAMQTQQIARSWLAYELTGTNTALGGVLIGFGVAGLVAIPTGGVLADRFTKRTILVTTQLVNTVTAVLIAVAIETDVIAYWMIVAASVVGGSTISILAPARMALSAEIVGRDGLTNAIMLGTMSAQVTRVVGPAAAGVMIGISVIGIAGVYWVSAVLSLIAVGLSVTLPEGAPRFVRDSGPLEDLKEGIRYTRSKPELVRLLVMSLGVVMFGFAHQGLSADGRRRFVRSQRRQPRPAHDHRRCRRRDHLSGIGQRQRTAPSTAGHGGVRVWRGDHLVRSDAELRAGARRHVRGRLRHVGLPVAQRIADLVERRHGVPRTCPVAHHAELLRFRSGRPALRCHRRPVGLRETMAGMGVAVILTAAHSTWWRRRIVAARIPDPLESL